MSGDMYYPNVSLLLPCDGANNSTTFIDLSPSSKTITIGGDAKITTAQSKFGGACAVFDGSGDYISISDPQLYAVDFTIEFWFNAAAVATANPIILTTYNITTVQNNTISILFSSSRKIFVYEPTTGIVASTTVLTLGNWYKIGVTYKGSNGETKLAVNNVVEATGALSISSSAATKMWVGGSPGDNNLGNEWLNGYVDELRITRNVIRNLTIVQTDSYPDYVSKISITLIDKIISTQFRTILSRISDGTLVSSEVITTSSSIKIKQAETGLLCLTLIPIQGDVWKPSTVYALNDLVIPILPTIIPYYFKRVGNSGTSGTTEPNWNTTGQCTDGIWINCWDVVEGLVQPITHAPLIPS